MADYKEPRPIGSTPGNTGTARHSTESHSTGTNGIAGRVREQATAQLSSQKTKATDGLGSVAQAVRQTTQHLRNEQHDTVARYAEQAADQIERFSQRLKEKDVSELMNDAQQLARRKPALFVGGAFALGLIGARFMKSSAPDDHATYGSTSGEYGRGGTTGGSVRPVQNAYGNRVPTTSDLTPGAGATSGTAGTATGAASRRPGYPPTEGL